MYYFIILENAAQLKLTSIDINEVSEVKWCPYIELLKLDCNKPLKHFIEKWKTNLKIIYDNRKTLTVKGTIASADEIQRLKNQIAVDQHDTTAYLTLNKTIEKLEEEQELSVSTDSD